MTVESFLDDIRTASTRTSYVTGICTFIHFIYSLPPIKGQRRTKEEREICFKKCNEYLKENRNFGDDLIAFIKSMTEKHCSPQLINVNTTAIKEFMIHHRIKLDEYDLKRIKKVKPPLSPINRKYAVSHEDIRKILVHSNLTLKSILLTLVSSGSRIAEIISLTLKDIELHDNYGTIYISRESAKNGKQRYSFISQEAVGFLKEYIRKEGKKDTDRLFDFTYENANYMLNLALKNAGMDERDENTDTRKITFRVFRAFYLSQLKLVIRPEIPEMLAGHEGYLTQNYRIYPKEQALEEYLKAVKMVTFEMPKEIYEIQNEFQTKMKSHSEIIESIVRENIELKDEQASMTQKIETGSRKNLELEEKISTLEATIAENQREMKRLIYYWSSMDEYPSRPYDDPDLSQEKRNELIDEEIKASEKHWEEVNSGKREFATYNPKPNNPK